MIPLDRPLERYHKSRKPAHLRDETLEQPSPLLSLISSYEFNLCVIL
jgi:hypothetical protein